MSAWIFHASGGLGYHARALRHSASWQSFAQNIAPAIASWVQYQHARHRPIALVGPSGGYTLPWAYLRQIPTLKIIEPDPIARRILRTRHPGLHFDPQPGLGWTSDGYCPQMLAHWNQQYREYALVFCNLLGQIPVQPRCSPRWRQAFAQSLRGRPWLSYHDLFSLDYAHPKTQFAESLPPVRNLRSTAAVQQWFAKHFEATKNRQSLYLVDHGTLDWLSAQRATPSPQQWLWPLRPSRWHLVEMLENRG